MSNCVVHSDYVSDSIYFEIKKESQNGSDSSTGHTEGKAQFKHIESEILLSDRIIWHCAVKLNIPKLLTEMVEEISSVNMV